MIWSARFYLMPQGLSKMGHIQIHLPAQFSNYFIQIDVVGMLQTMDILGIVSEKINLIS